MSELEPRRLQKVDAATAPARSTATPGRGSNTGSAASGPVSVASSSGPLGGAARGDGAWEADAGLLGAMGLGDGAAPAAGGGAAVQMRAAAEPGSASDSSVHDTAARGVGGSGGALPHLDRIQRLFGRHDVTGVSAHTGGDAAAASRALGAEAYATGNAVAFGSSSPSLHTAAHEAAHVVQQQAGVQLQGGVGEVGDRYERHADAVADQVVQGKSAEGLLDPFAPGAGGAGGAVQATAVQREVKADLREAMSGWGTDEAAIFARLQHASQHELLAVLSDPALMAELKKDLSPRDMGRVLDLLDAPLSDKLRLALGGSVLGVQLVDTEYLQRTLDRATPAQLQLASTDVALTNQLARSLSGSLLKTVLDRLQVPLVRKIGVALSGWGSDEDYVLHAIRLASLPDAMGLAQNAVLMAKLDAEGWTSLRPQLAHRIFPGGGSPDVAFSALVTGDDRLLDQRLAAYGNPTLVHYLLDGVIAAGADAVRVQRAFHAYWHVAVASAPAIPATAGGGGKPPTPAVAARDWPIATLQSIHAQMKLLPSQDTRAGAWTTLSLTSDHNLINRAAFGGGNFIVGSNASPTFNLAGGYSTRTFANADVGDQTLDVREAARFKVGDKLAIDKHTADRDDFTLKAIDEDSYQIAPALRHAHAPEATIEPGDGSGMRPMNWLANTVRHEIAHAVDGSAVDTRSFSAKGEWVLGEGDAGFDAWVQGMGGEAAWTCDGGKVDPHDRIKIKAAIVHAVTTQGGSLYQAYAADPAHPITVYRSRSVPVIEAAEICLRKGDNFWTSPAELYAANGKRFAISWWYRRFQHHNEAVVSERVSEYGLYSPAEFFAEAYTVFYEEAGRPGVADADLGRLVRNTGWRQWIRDHVHERGLAPAGTGAARAPAGAPAGGPEPGAHPGGASRGRAAGNPGS